MLYRFALLSIIAASTTFIACSGASSTAPETESSTENLAGKKPMVGGDRDAHGCIGSAGYSWCAKENACVRPWELASSQVFPNTQEDFTAYCNPPMPGSDRDEHGCIGSAGYSWCAKENACVRSWELASSQGFPNTQEDFTAYCNPPMPGSDRDEHGCIGSAGYSWCAKENACVRSWELASSQGFPNTQEAFTSYCGTSK